MRNSTKRIFKRSLSGFLALITLVGVLASLSIIPVFAADNEDPVEEISYADRWNKYYTEPSDDVDFTTEEKRLAAMGNKPYYTNANFELYVDDITGEVAIKDKATGDVMFTNPYDISEYPTSSDASGKKAISADVKQELLSQIQIAYTDNTENGNTKYYNSFKHSALLGQIDVKRLNGGVRIEYSIGEEQTRLLVPQRIQISRFNEMLIGQLETTLPRDENGNYINRTLEKFVAFFDKEDPYGKGISETEKAEIFQDYPATLPQNLGEGVYVWSEENTMRELKQVETWIKQYCPKYTFEELDKDHKATGYEEKQLVIANFKMALEYYLTDNGVEVRFPANGLTFDETNFGLTNIDVLKYMGAGNTVYNGYTFVPDGSGSITRFEDVLNNTISQSGKVYGQDYAYQGITGQNQQVFRLPVFGVVTTDELRTGVDASTLVSGQRNYSTGYVAVITEGDAMTTITSVNGGRKYNYGSTYCSFNPRPKDSYVLSDAISASGGEPKPIPVVSDRKYTGSFKINYIMLTSEEHLDGSDSEKAAKLATAQANGRKFYETSYVGMAKAYREYLESEGEIQKITTTDNENIPLYVEVFGATETEESLLSIPVTVKKPLTTFDDLKSITEDLYTAKSPITNINYRLKGFTNGGMVSTVPTKVKFEKVVGGNAGLRDFLDYANEKGIGVYPEFDFVYMEDTAAFDGFSYKRDAVKTIDNRYTTKRVYDAVLQTFTKTDKICISTSVYRDFFEKFNKSMSKVVDGRTTGISVGTLGSELNSDFDKDDPYNREDAKGFTEEMLSQIKNGYGSVMVDGGNAYTVKYASVILNAPLDSSRYLSASNTIPFFGLVFHGYVEFAGAPTNMSGDIKYEMLKIIENGATLYMMFSAQNVELLKKDEELSKYYAINYDIWKLSLLGLEKQTIVNEDGKKEEVEVYVGNGLYDRLNNALKDVQTYRISDHSFVVCNRQLTVEEKNDIATDAKTEYIENLAKLNSALKRAEARLELYKRIDRDYTGDERTKYLNAYGLIDDISVHEANRNDAYQAVVDAEANGTTPYEEAAKAKIDLKIDDGSVVYVEYENGHYFLLNYNSYTVEVELENGETVEIAPKDFYDSKANA